MQSTQSFQLLTLSHDQQARFLDVAHSIGRQLVRDAIWHDGRCTWLVWAKEYVIGSFRSVYRAAPLNLYLGVSGIALFLARLTSFTADRNQRQVLDGAIRLIKDRITEVAPTVGLYTGSLGVAYTLVNLGEIIGDEHCTRAGMAGVERVLSCSPAPNELDLMSGCAGAIIALLDLAKRFNIPLLLDRAQALADLLISKAVHSNEGVSWPSQAGERQNLVGLSHGTTGIALALLEFNAVSPDRKYLETAKEALRYERHLFDSTRGNWPDFRSVPGMPTSQVNYPVAWCHGSTGIGIARLRMRELLPNDEQFLPEMDIALANAITSLNNPISSQSSDFTLCHGLTGNGELLLLIAEYLGRHDAQLAAQQVGEAGIRTFHTPRSPWGCGIPECGETPSLMTGTAGIGLYYLRLIDPRGVETILLPRVHTSPSKADGEHVIAGDLVDAVATERGIANG